MMKKLLFLAVLVSPILTSAQTIYETVSSPILGESRDIKIQLPRNYNENTDKNYPVIIVLDGDYLFEPVAGNVDYYSYWEDAPEMIVVGINQSQTRNDDAFYSHGDNLPSAKGADFFEFLGMELMQHLDKKYRTAPFRIAVGHDFTSNFINYYLLKSNPLFDGYINLSPDLAPQMINRVTSSLSRSKTKTWYYLATASDDVPRLKEDILAFDYQLQNIDNDWVSYQFDNFDDATHYSLVGKAIPSALEKMFKIYGPISKNEYNEKLLEPSVSPYNYLLDKYKNINELYGLEKQIRLDDFMAVHNAIEKKSKWDEYKELSKLAEDHYPGTMLATYFEARYEEETGDPEDAVETYKKAYGQQKIAFLDTDFMLTKADELKKNIENQR